MSEFTRMRARLVDAGLIDDDFRITDAGMAYTDQIIADLREAEPAAPPAIAVVWDTRRVKVRT